MNEYGEWIDVSAALHRGMLWHAYGRGIRMVAGYAALQWVNRSWNLIDPWRNANSLYPQVGYGGGALIWRPRPDAAPR